ncbi:hypothetical protein FKM82_024268 [Ascaphus truei]
MIHFECCMIHYSYSPGPNAAHVVLNPSFLQCTSTVYFHPELFVPTYLSCMTFCKTVCVTVTFLSRLVQRQAPVTHPSQHCKVAFSSLDYLLKHLKFKHPNENMEKMRTE